MKSSASSNTEGFPSIVRLRRKRLHVFVTYFKRKNDVTPSNAITPTFPSLADEIAEPRPDMNIKAAALK